MSMNLCCRRRGHEPDSKTAPTGHETGLLMADPVSPRLALGCAQLGNLYRARSDEEAAAILEEAWDAGIRQFDTAPHYGLGLSERRLGAFPHGKPRDQFTVSTKVGRLLVPSPGTASSRTGQGTRPGLRDARHLAACRRTSVRRRSSGRDGDRGRRGQRGAGARQRRAAVRPAAGSVLGRPPGTRANPDGRTGSAVTRPLVVS
jgi:Aldo/keto reductase family